MSGEILHRLWALGAALAGAVYLALTVAGRLRERAVRRRGAFLLEVPRSRKRHYRWLRWQREAGSAKQWVAPLGAWSACWVLVGGTPGWAAGLAVAYGVWRWQRSRRARGSDVTDTEAAAVVRQLPLAADLLAACISAGAGPREAAEAVGESMGGPVGHRLTRTAAEILLGGEPAEAWGRFAEIPGAGPLARCLERAGSTGAPAAGPVSRLADEMRAERSSAAVARAQRAGVLITAPVGLCFLPAFLAVGVAPVVIGLATGLLHTN